MEAITSVEVVENGGAVRLAWNDGSQARFHAVWLRDNSPDSETRSPSNGQRLITVLDLAPDLTIT